jgi:hypothetical protein
MTEKKTSISVYRIVCKETTTEIYEIEAISEEQARDYLLLDGTLKPVFSKLMVHPPTVKKIKHDEDFLKKESKYE